MRDRKFCHGRAVFLLSAIFLMALPLLLGGCALTESGGKLALEELPGQEARLAGVFVTSEPIVPDPPELEFNSRGEIMVKDRGPEKIYGSFAGYDEGNAVVTFPGLEGYGVYTLTAPEDETHAATGDKYTVCDFPFANLNYYVSDQKNSIEADLYVSAERFIHYYFNPVYQQADGQIYLLVGSGLSSDSFSDGQRFSHSISESVSYQSSKEQSQRTQEYTVNIIGSNLPQETELLLMNEENQMLERYTQAQLEELSDAGASLTLPEGASYLILRQAKAGKEHDSRTLFDQSAEYVEYMAPAENEILYYRHLGLVWP